MVQIYAAKNPDVTQPHKNLPEQFTVPELIRAVYRDTPDSILKPIQQRTAKDQEFISEEFGDVYVSRRILFSFILMDI